MNNKKKWVINIFTLFLISGIMYGCSTQKANQNSMIDMEVENRIKEVMVTGELPSVQIAVINQNQIIWSETLGENSDTNYLYMNGSVQKVVDATAVLQL